MESGESAFWFTEIKLASGSAINSLSNGAFQLCEDHTLPSGFESNVKAQGLGTTEDVSEKTRSLLPLPRVPAEEALCAAAVAERPWLRGRGHSRRQQRPQSDV